ncbi:MAG: flagellar biosynthesis protein FlhG [Planctomycetota bacterium]|jgi:flagellar biosynthesis protein FlhG
MFNLSRFDLGRIRALRRFRAMDQRISEEVELASRVVCIASGKGGAGKSVLATNLAVTRARAGEKVCLIDFDAGLANAHLMLGLSPNYDIGDVIAGKATIDEALIEGPEGVMLLSGGVGRTALANPTRRELDRLYRRLRPMEQVFDLIVIDHGAGLGYSTVTHLAATSTLILVTNPEVTALSDAYALYKQAHGVNPKIHVGLVVNRARDEEAALQAQERFESVSQRFMGCSPEFIGWVPQDDAVYWSVQRRRPVCLGSPKSGAAIALNEIAQWGPIDLARTTKPFYERARRALR